MRAGVRAPHVGIMCNFKGIIIHVDIVVVFNPITVLLSNTTFTMFLSD